MADLVDRQGRLTPDGVRKAGEIGRQLMADRGIEGGPIPPDIVREARALVRSGHTGRFEKSQGLDRVSEAMMDAMYSGEGSQQMADDFVSPWTQTQSIEKRQLQPSLIRRQFPDPTTLEAVEAVPGAQPRSEEDIRREIMMELQRDNPDYVPPMPPRMGYIEKMPPMESIEKMPPRMGSFLESQTDVELMRALNPENLPQQQPREMESRSQTELDLAFQAAAIEASEATRKLSESGVSNAAIEQLRIERQNATDRMARIKEEQERRRVGAAAMAGDLMVPDRAPAPAAGGGDTSRFMERDPIMAYRGGGMAGLKKKVGKYAQGGLAPRIVGETGPEVALVGEEGPELVMTAKQTRDLLAILGEPSPKKEIKSVPLAAYDEGGVTGVTRAEPTGEELTTDSLERYISYLRDQEPTAELAFDPSTSEMLAQTTLDTLGNPYVAGAITAASFIPVVRGGALATRGLATTTLAGARGAAARGGARAGAGRVATGSAPGSAGVTGGRLVTGAPPVRTTPLTAGTGGVVRPVPNPNAPAIRVPPPRRSPPDAVNSYGRMSDAQRAAVRSDLRTTNPDMSRMSNSQIDDLITQLRSVRSTTTQMGAGTARVENPPSLASRIIQSIDRHTRPSAIEAFRQTSSLYDTLPITRGSRERTDEMFQRVRGERLAEEAHDQRIEDYWQTRREATDEEARATFRDYGQATVVMEAGLRRIERKREKGEPLTAVEEATLRDPGAVLYLYREYGDLNSQLVQDNIAWINAGGQEGQRERERLAEEESRSTYEELERQVLDSHVEFGQ